MLQRNPDKRLGAERGTAEMKEHPWLADFPWLLLNQKKLKAPFVPLNQNNWDQDNIDEPWRDLQDELFIKS
jgi:hypothetical protein